MVEKIILLTIDHENLFFTLKTYSSNPALLAILLLLLIIHTFEKVMLRNAFKRYFQHITNSGYFFLKAAT